MVSAEMAEALCRPDAPAHGSVSIGFCPDEEVGHGAALMDLERFGAELAYTLDGGDSTQMVFLGTKINNVNEDGGADRKVTDIIYFASGDLTCMADILKVQKTRQEDYRRYAESGRMICQKILNSDAPSIRAASSISLEMPFI